MKNLSVSVIALAVATLGFASAAQAQQQAKKLFFEGAIVRHAAQKTGCVLLAAFSRKAAQALGDRAGGPPCLRPTLHSRPASVPGRTGTTRLADRHSRHHADETPAQRPSSD